MAKTKSNLKPKPKPKKTIVQKRLAVAKRNAKYDGDIRIICLACDIPFPEKEHKFAEGRRYAFDYAWVDKKVALEIDGRVHRVHDDRWLSDIEKFNIATSLGWRVIHFTPNMIDQKNLTKFNVLETIVHTINYGI